MTMQYRMIKAWDIAANDPDQAKAIAEVLPPNMAVVRRSALPDSRGTPSELFEQPLEILDLAWDVYMDATVLADLERALETGDDPPMTRLPTLAELAKAKVGPATLSMLFDLAISAYRRSLIGPSLDG